MTQNQTFLPLLRSVLRLLLPGLCFLFAMGRPVLAAPQDSPIDLQQPEYVVGRITEIQAETTVEDEAFGRSETHYRFQVYFPAQKGAEAETIQMEQSYGVDTPPELLPRVGKRFIFYKETLVDGSHAYTLVDVQRLNRVHWILIAVVVLLVLMGRWFGIKALLISGGMLGTFWFFHLFHFPWMLNSFFTFISITVLSALLTFGLTPRFNACLASTFAGGVTTLVLIWFSKILAVSSPAVLLQSGLLLQMAGGLSYISISTIRAIHITQRTEPGLSRTQLFKKGFVGGQGAIEVVATLYLVLMLGQVLNSAYAQGPDPGLLQMEPILTDMASLLFMLMGFALCLPLSALIGSRLLSRSR